MFAGARRAFKRPTGPGASRPTPIKSDRDCPVGPSAPLQSGCPADASAVPSGLVPRLQEVLYRPGPACRRCAAASRPPLEAERLIPRSGAQLSGGAPSLPPRPISRGVFKIAVGPAAPGRCPPRRAPPPPCRPLGGDKQAACARAASSDPLSLAGVSVASVAPQWSRRSTRGRGAARHSIPANTTQPAGGGLRGGGGGTPPGRPASPRLGAPAEPGMSPPDFCGGPGTGAGSPLPWRPPTPFPAPPPAARAFPSWSSQSRRPASLNAVRGIAFSSGPPCSPPFLQSASGPARSRARPSALCAGAVAILAAGVRDDRLGRSSGPLRRASDVEHGSGKIISPDPSPVLGLLPLAPSPPPPF